MIGDAHSLTPGYVARHVPPGSRLGLDIAILDIAQDFLLAHLAEAGFFSEMLVFKGGTALRKFFAGSAGRFSTDLDMATRDFDVDRQEVAGLIAEHADTTLGPFEFEPHQNRNRWSIRVRSQFGNPAVTMKLDVGPPCWIEPDERLFVATATQSRYGFVPPPIPVMPLEEILAEKVARLTRSATARDASDLVWARSTSPHSNFSAAFVRRLAVLKVWVDNNGIGNIWRPALAPRSFNPDTWLAPRERWDDEQIWAPRSSAAHPDGSRT